jgi:exosome complex component RRP46
LLPGLLTTALLSLLAANIPLCATVSPVLAFTYTLNIKQNSSNTSIVDNDSSTLSNSIVDVIGQNGGEVSAIHLFAFDQAGELLLSLSEGDFSPDEWDEACQMAEERVTGEQEDGAMDIDTQKLHGETTRQFLLDTVKEA